MRLGALETDSSNSLDNKLLNFNHFGARGHDVTVFKPVAMAGKCFMGMQIPGKMFREESAIMGITAEAAVLWA